MRSAGRRNPSARWRARWPSADLAVVINHGPGEEALADAVRESSGGTAFPLKCSVGELIALTRRASLFIGGDTGPMHLAAALRVPVVALFGPTRPERNGPYGTRSVVLRSPRKRGQPQSHRTVPTKDWSRSNRRRLSRRRTSCWEATVPEPQTAIVRGLEPDCAPHSCAPGVRSSRPSIFGAPSQRGHRWPNRSGDCVAGNFRSRRRLRTCARRTACSP